MVTRILSAVVLAPLFFVVLFFLPPVFLAVLLACITARASFELLRATKVAHHNGMYVYTAAAAGLIPLTFWLGWGNWSLAALSLLLMAALFLGAIRRFDSGSACPQSLLIQDIRVNGDMGRLQVCDRQRAGHGQRRGEPPGGMAAAPGIVAAQGADRGGVVSVGGPGLVFQAVVVGGTGITVVNDRRQRIAGSAALIDTGQEVHFLFFLPGGGQSPLPHAAQQLFTDKGLVHRQPRRHIRQQDTHRRTVGLAEKRVVHHDSSTSQFPPRAASSRQKVG